MVDWVQLLKDYAIGITAFITIVSGIIYIWRTVIKPVWKQIQRYDDLHDKIDVIFSEITPNEGKSMKDSINYIKSKLNLVSERQKAIVADDETALFETDSEGNCLWVNRTYTRLVQRDSSEILGHGWVNCVHEKDRDMVVTAWQEAVDDKREITLSFKFETPTEQVIPVRGRSYIMTDSEGEVLGYLGSIKVLDE